VRGLLPFLCAAGLTFAPTALAQPSPAGAAKDARPAKPSKPRASALSSVARDLAAALPAVEGRVVVAVAPLESDAKATRADALVVTIAALMAGQRAWEPPTEPASLLDARTKARGATALVYVTIHIERGKVHAAADLYLLPRTVWARAKNPTPGPTAHGFAEADVDAEVRAHLEPIPLTSALTTTRAKHFENDVSAIACGDLDRDGGNELVTVSPDQVTLLRLKEGKVEPVGARLWKDLSAVDGTPWREPIAAAIIAPPPFDDPLAPRDVVVSATDRAKSVRLDAHLETQASFAAFALPVGRSYACARLDALELTGPLEACADGEPGATRPSVGGRYDAIAGARLVDREGRPFEVFAGREGSTVEIFDDAGRSAKIPGAGAELAIGDLDQDGAPEILTSLDVDARSGRDALVVFTWARDGKPPKEVLRMPVGAGVRAIGVCPPDSAGRAPIVVATTGEILVTR